jgi:hypothetical protein
MTYDDIVKQARTENDHVVRFDMRKFPEEQGEALEVWLQNTGMGVQMSVFRHTKPIVLLCDSSVEVSDRARQMLASLQSKAIAVQIQKV